MSTQAGAATAAADREAWVEDTELQVAPRLGLQVIVDIEPDDATLLNRACEALRLGYDEFLLRAMREHARAVVERRHAGPPALLTVAEAAARFGVTRARLQRAAMEGRLPAHKVGAGKSHPWLVHPDDVERFLRESQRGPKRRVPA